MNKIANTDYEITIIQTLRQEARELKDCYTRFAFQAIAFSAVALGLIIRYQPAHPLVALSSIGVILFLAATVRLGTYKYASVNRLYGYELYLFQTRDLENSAGDGWQPSMRAIGWEEAMVAWRIVQSTIFRHLYYSNRVIPQWLRKKHRTTKNKWFDQKMLYTPNTPTAVYHAGSYLRNMNTVMFWFAALFILSQVIMVLQLRHTQWPWWVWPWWVVVVAVPVGSSLFMFVYRGFRAKARRKMIESGFLSIHSCAIMWQAVIVAHYRAINEARKAGNERKYYIKYLAQQADSLASNIFEIYEWIQDTEKNTGSCQVETPVSN